MNTERQKTSFNTDMYLDLYGVFDRNDIDQVYTELQKAETAARAKYPQASRFYLDVCHGYEDVEIVIMAERYETDAEYNLRVSREQKLELKRQKEQDEKEKQERALYAKLKEKYGDA